MTVVEELFVDLHSLARVVLAGKLSSSGTAAVTRVLIESGDGVSTWTTIGVHENIIEASLQALVDSLEYGLLRQDFTASHRAAAGAM